MSFFNFIPPDDIGLKVESFLNNNGISHETNSNSLILTCPKCNKDKLYISKDKGHFICFHCADNGVKGPSPYYALSLLTDKSISDIKSELEVIDTRILPQAKAISKTVIPYIPKRFIKINEQEALEGANYLFKRGVDVQTALQYNIQYDPKNRAVAFMCKEGSNYVGYQTRSIDPNCPKEKQKFTMSGFEKSKHFLFQEYIKGDSVILAEGPISAIKFAKTGIPFIASMGKAISENQVNKLLALGITKVYLGLDRDAFKEINKFILKYRTVFDIYHLKVPYGRDDFGDSSYAECVESYRRAGEPLIYPLEFDADNLGNWCF